MKFQFKTHVVKRIQVQGFEVKNIKGTSGYMYIDGMVLSTKCSLDKMELRGVEKAKTECAKRLFNSISTNIVRYGVVDKFGNCKNH